MPRPLHLSPSASIPFASLIKVNSSLQVVNPVASVRFPAAVATLSGLCSQLPSLFSFSLTGLSSSVSCAGSSSSAGCWTLDVGVSRSSVLAPFLSLYLLSPRLQSMLCDFQIHTHGPDSPLQITRSAAYLLSPPVCLTVAFNSNRFISFYFF